MQMSEIVEILRPQAAALPRFAVILRGEYFQLIDEEGNSECLGFYIVRTVTAADQATAEDLALFDFRAEILSDSSMNARFSAIGNVFVEESGPIDEDIDDCNSSFIFYPMDERLPV